MADAALAPASRTAKRWRGGLLVPILFVALAALPLAFQDRFTLSLVSRAMIYGIAALSLDFILGFGALVSFGHAAFLGIGAYAIGIASANGVTELTVALPIALVAAGAFALVTGAISLKTRGVYFIMITLAFGQMAFFTAQSLSAYGGDDGLRIAARSLVFGTSILHSDIALYYAILVALVAAFLLLAAVTRSRFGRVLRGAKENERRMRALGFNPYPYRLAAYVLAGMVAAVAGTFLAELSTFVSPAYMSWQRSGDLIVMVVAGGLGTLSGPILGALGVTFVEEWMAELSEHWKAAFGLLVVVVAVFARGGIARLIRRAP